MGAQPVNVSAWERAIADALHAESRRLNDMAKFDAFTAMRCEIPDPEEYARYLPLRQVEILKSAYQGLQGYRVAVDQAAELRPHGLAEYGGPYLTAFGMAVRRALIAEDRDG